MDSKIRTITFPVGSFACNCTIIFSSETRDCLVVDPGTEPDKVLQHLKSQNLNVQMIIHTHAHFDHIGRSTTLKTNCGHNPPIALHQEDLFLFNALEEQSRFFGEEVDKEGKIDHFLNDQEVLRLGMDCSLKVIHTPGHTPGSVCFYLESSDRPLLLSGDTLFRRSIGRTDLPGGDFPLIKKSIKERLISGLPLETECVPGHGPNTTLEEEKKENPFL